MMRLYQRRTILLLVFALINVVTSLKQCSKQASSSLTFISGYPKSSPSLPFCKQYRGSTCCSIQDARRIASSALPFFSESIVTVKPTSSSASDLFVIRGSGVASSQLSVLDPSSSSRLPAYSERAPWSTRQYYPDNVLLPPVNSLSAPTLLSSPASSPKSSKADIPSRLPSDASLYYYTVPRSCRQKVQSVLCASCSPRFGTDGTGVCVSDCEDVYDLCQDVLFSIKDGNLAGCGIEGIRDYFSVVDVGVSDGPNADRLSSPSLASPSSSPYLCQPLNKLVASGAALCDLLSVPVAHPVDTHAGTEIIARAVATAVLKSNSDASGKTVGNETASALLSAVAGTLTKVSLVSVDDVMNSAMPLSGLRHTSLQALVTHTSPNIGGVWRLARALFVEAVTEQSGGGEFWRVSRQKQCLSTHAQSHALRLDTEADPLPSLAQVEVAMWHRSKQEAEDALQQSNGFRIPRASWTRDQHLLWLGLGLLPSSVIEFMSPVVEPLLHEGLHSVVNGYGYTNLLGFELPLYLLQHSAAKKWIIYGFAGSLRLVFILSLLSIACLTIFAVVFPVLVGINIRKKHTLQQQQRAQQLWQDELKAIQEAASEASVSPSINVNNIVDGGVVGGDSNASVQPSMEEMRQWRMAALKLAQTKSSPQQPHVVEEVPSNTEKSDDSTQ